MQCPVSLNSVSRTSCACTLLGTKEATHKPKASQIRIRWAKRYAVDEKANISLSMLCNNHRIKMAGWWPTVSISNAESRGRKTEEQQDADIDGIVLGTVQTGEDGAMVQRNK